MYKALPPSCRMDLSMQSSAIRVLPAAVGTAMTTFFLSNTPLRMASAWGGCKVVMPEAVKTSMTDLREGVLG